MDLAVLEGHVQVGAPTPSYNFDSTIYTCLHEHPLHHSVCSHDVKNIDGRGCIAKDILIYHINFLAHHIIVHMCIIMATLIWNLLVAVFKNGELLIDYNLDDIRDRAKTDVVNK